MCGTEFSDVLFGTPKPIDTEANLGVMNADNVNIVVHGHDPSLSEMVCEYADDPEMIAYAKSMGAKGITVSGVCCTSNEVAMRRGIPMAGNFLQQENVVLTGACEAVSYTHLDVYKRQGQSVSEPGTFLGTVIRRHHYVFGNCI